MIFLIFKSTYIIFKFYIFYTSKKEVGGWVLLLTVCALKIPLYATELLGHLNNLRSFIGESITRH